ncbi:MAG: polysaccharide biosynthesis/export family protein [Deltaproteobacteria bacterium]|nr:polysaccharide biosynthesis/export family protein [Deltaproteobacteria bacterium]
MQSFLGSTAYLRYLLIGAAVLCLQGCIFQWLPFQGGATAVPAGFATVASQPHPNVAAVQKQLITSLAGYDFQEIRAASGVRTSSVLMPGDLMEILYQIVEEFPSAGYRLKPDDKLNVSHVFDPQFDVNVRVDSAGEVYLPLVEKVKVGGLTLDQAINKVRDKFREYVTKPHIMIRLEEFNHAAESRKRTIKTMNVNGPFKEFLIPTDGNISVPFIARINVLGKTLDQVKEDLEKSYTRMGIQTEVTCILKKVSARRVYVMGDVQKAGVYTYETSVNLAQAISMAEGFKKLDIRQTVDLADASGILIFRTRGVRRPTAFRVNLVPTLLAGTPEGSFPLQMDDVVYVPQMARPRVFVFGEVGTPGPYEVHGAASITQAISLAGGLKDTACRKSLLVIRKQHDSGPPAVLVDLNNILKTGGGNDFMVAAGDVVYVPKKWIANVDVFIDQWFTRGLYALLPANSPLDFYIDVWEACNQRLRKKKLEKEIENLQYGIGTNTWVP